MGPIALPLLPEQAGRIIGTAEAAPYGRGEETVIDPAVRRCRQVGPDRVPRAGVIGLAWFWHGARHGHNSAHRRSAPWPGGARCAVAAAFGMDADSLLQYGPTADMPCTLRVYRALGLRQTLFIPSWRIKRYPAVLKDGHEIGRRGYLHGHPNELPEEQEAYWFDRALTAFQTHVGARPAGCRAPSYQFSRRTLGLPPSQAGEVYRTTYGSRSGTRS